MVEVIRTIRRRCIALAAALAAGIGLVKAQQPDIQARIAGLEENPHYMALLREEVQLQAREDSTVRAVEALRRQLRDDPDNRQQYSDRIRTLENSIFALRRDKGQLIDRINAIEQEWVFANLNGGGVQRNARPAAGEVPDAEKVANLTGNRCFSSGLPAEDYAALCEAQRREPLAAALAERYIAAHRTEADLAAAYAAAQSEEEAEQIQERFGALQEQNRQLADSLGQVWTYIFDNKSYAYDYLLDTQGREALLAAQQKRLDAAMQEAASLRGKVASEELTDYILRKRVTTDYERALAETYGLTAAGDSLKGVAARLGEIDPRLERVRITPRSFIVYDSIVITRTPRYTAQNPIPECRIHAVGTIYRILLGRFDTRRPVSTFRNAAPLSYLVDEQQKWCYYAGGFATAAEAEAARAQLKKAGFIRPEIVVWEDGRYRNLSHEEAQGRTFRLEITGREELGEGVRTLLRERAAGAEFSRLGTQRFAIGPFDDREAAELLAASLRESDPTLEIRITELRPAAPAQ